MSRGSSYSASLTLQLAAREGKALAAAAVFSPGEYFDDSDRVRNAVAQIETPVYITTDPAEKKARICLTKAMRVNFRSRNDWLTKREGKLAFCRRCVRGEPIITP